MTPAPYYLSALSLHDALPIFKRWVRQGVISKAWLGTGEEAVTIGSVHALDREQDIVAPMIRNAGACHEMGMPLTTILDRKSTRLNSSHVAISYAVFCLKKKKT